MTSRLEEAIAQFDLANGEDPTTEVVDGLEVPKELLYSRRMSSRLEGFFPGAPEEVQLAVRCQHICRWRIPRTDYPEGRAGYLKWRTDLAKMHADIAAAILRDVGYDADLIERVRTILRKRGLKTNPEVQLLEDVACLVFLEHYFHDFAKQHDEDKILGIVQKTWKKMTEKAHEAALQLDYTPEDLALIERALS